MDDLPTVLLLVEHDRNRELLAERLGEAHDVVTPSDDDDLPEFDLCIGDREGLARHHEVIGDRKHEVGGVFLPVLLLRDEQDIDPPDWVLTLVDDVETTPIREEALSELVTDLLERREESTDLVTQRRRELRQQEAFTEAAFEAMPDLFYVFDPDGSLRRWNGRAPEVTGYDDSELEEMHTLDFLPAPDRERVAAQIAEVLEEGCVRTVEVPLVTNDGEQIPYEFRVAPLYDLDDRVAGGVGIGRDVTDRQMRRELARQNERLEKFASIVSHDLRNPIAVANGYLDLAKDDCDSPHVDRATDAIGRMETLIDDLLALARQGKVVDETERVSLSQVAAEAWNTIDASGASFRSTTDSEVLADRSRLRQLFENLFRNAVEHGSTGSQNAARSGDAAEHGGADVTVTIGDTDRGFYVADDGPGIPPEVRDNMFEYGYTTSEEGTGFGLAIVREIADAHGWGVEVTESESGGARFEFEGVERPVLDDN